MKSDLVKVVFTGQLDGTLSVDVIRNKLAKLLNQNHEKVESFFNGKPFLIKKNVDQITAEKYKNTLKQAGAICIIKPEDEKQEETTQNSDNLKIISNKSTCKIVKLDIHRTDLRLSPLTCSLITSIPGGIKIHRPEKEAAEFSEILSVSICSPTGNIKDLQVLLFIKGLIRPVSVKPVNIRFSDFWNNSAISSTDSIKQFINYLCKKCSDLIMDKNTYEFISSTGGHIPKEDPNRLSTAMGDILNPGKKKLADSTKAPLLKNQDFKKIDNEPSEMAYHGRSQVQEKSETGLSMQKTMRKAKPANLSRNKFALLGGISLGIILIAVGCLWIGTNLNDAKKIDTTVDATTYDARHKSVGLTGIILFKETEAEHYKHYHEIEAKKAALMAQQYRKEQNKIDSEVDAEYMKAREQKKKLKPGCRISALILYIGFWIFFSGFGKMRAIKRYENQLETDPTAFDADDDKHFNAVKFIWSGTLVLVFSAILISISVDVMIDNLGKTYLVKASAGAFLLLIGDFLLYTGYKYTQPSINLRVLLHPKYILIRVIVLLTIFVGNHYYQSSKASKEYLRYNQTELEKYRVKFDFQRKEIFRQNFFVSEDLIQEVHGECSFRGKDELIAGLHADDIDNTNDIIACFARLRDPAIIEPFFMWYQKQLDAGQYFSTSSMGDIIIVMKSKSVDPLSNALTSLENQKATDLAAKLLATIHTEESIRVLADAITGNSFPAAHSAGRVLAIVSSSPYVEIDKSFELVSLVYSFDDPGLRKIAIETLRIFDGTAANDLAMAATEDPDSEVAE